MTESNLIQGGAISDWRYKGTKGTIEHSSNRAIEL